MDDDGDLDLFVWGADGGHLLLSEGVCVLRDATDEAGLVHNGDVVTMCEWLDGDGDGREDLVLSTTGRVLLFRSHGMAQFGAFDLDRTVAPKAHSGSSLVPTGVSDLTAEKPEDGPGIAAPDLSAPTTNKKRPRDSRVAVDRIPANAAATTGTEELPFGGICATSVRDANLGTCIHASAVPTLGMLMPMSRELNVAPWDYVGIGTTNPVEKLTVSGNIRAQGQPMSTVLSKPPLFVSSTRLLLNLNADRLDGLHASSFTQLGQLIDSGEIVSGSLVDAHVSTSAAIAGSKIDADFGAQNVTTDFRVAAGTSTPLVPGHFQQFAIGLSSAHLDDEDLLVESADAFLGLVSNSTGQFGSGITLRESGGGALRDTWSLIRETQSSGADLRFTCGT